MNRISLYIFLILIFLGLAKSFSPSIQGVLFIHDKKDYTNLFHEQPISIILLDSFETGFLIKTYLQKYQIVHGFKPPKKVLVKTSKKFWEETRDFIGMSLFRRNEIDGKESLVPMPPGILFVGDLSFGYWVNEDSGQKTWRFHNAYKEFPVSFYWGSFKFTKEKYNKALIFEKSSKPFFGINNEFGTSGSITKKNIVDKFSNLTEKEISYLEHFKKYLTMNTKAYHRSNLESQHE